MRLLFILLIGLLITSPAKADYFVIKDAEYDYTFSVPDRWASVSSMASRAKHGYMAPGDDFAGCAIAAEKDKRYLVYKSDEMKHAVNAEFDKEFFATMAPKMNLGNNVAEHVRYTDPKDGGLGDGFSKQALVDYVDPITGVQKRSIVLATIYHDMKMVVSCQSKVETFGDRFKELMGIVSSIEFDDRYRPYPTLYYRDFLGRDMNFFEEVYEDVKQEFND